MDASSIRNRGLAAVSLGMLVLGTALAPAWSAPAAKSIDGRWNASLTRDGTVIPFRLDISGFGKTLKGTLYNGFEPYDGTTSATFENGKLVLSIDQYLTTITATLQDGKLVGSVATKSRGPDVQYGFEATRYVKPAVATTNAPSIAGSWVIPLSTPSAKGEHAFRFIVQQHGPEVAAAILRVDGDTGAYSGTFADGKWVLSHFDGSRPGVIVVSPAKDGTLDIQQTDRPRSSAAPVRTGAPGGTVATPARTIVQGGPGAGSSAGDRRIVNLVAYRSDVAQAKGLPEPDDYDTYTVARDPQQKFTFNFPDADGKWVSNDDPRFKGKVLLVVVSGTWCPNCHDEAQYLVQLDRKYRRRGLAIVALEFEGPDEQENRVRDRAFAQKYGVKYTSVLAGEPSQVHEKIPQLINLNNWPTTVFVGRDGLVKAIHAGFASPASGEFYRQLQRQFTAKVEQLLAQKPAAPGTAVD